MSHSPFWKLSVKQLGSNLAEAVELVELLREAVPHIRVEAYEHTVKPSSGSTSSTPRNWTLHERLQKAEPCSIDQGVIDWKDLRLVVSTENLRSQESSFEDGAQVVEVNTGGRVFFCFTRPSSIPASSPLKPAPTPESPPALHSTRSPRTPARPLLAPTQGSRCSTAETNATSIGAAPTSGTWLGTLSATAESPPDSPFSAALRGPPQQQLPAAQALERYLQSADASSGSESPRTPAAAGQQQQAADLQDTPPVSYPNTPVANAQPSEQLPQQPGAQPGSAGRHAERVVVLKVASSRLLAQAEQFANELTRYLDICAPECRIIRQVGSTAEEWRQLCEAAGALGDDGCELLEELQRVPCALLMEYVPGTALVAARDAFKPPARHAACSDLGALFLLDMLLGNADRLPCRDLGWRGNAGNVLHGGPGGKYCGRLVAIDSAVQRRPPALRCCADDERTERLAQLLLHSEDTAAGVLGQVLGDHPDAAAVAADPSCVAAFQQGLRACLDRVMQIQGLLEMVAQVQQGLMDSFLQDVAAASPELRLAQPDRLPSPSAAALGAAAAAAGGGSGGGSTPRRASPSEDGGSCFASPDPCRWRHHDGSSPTPRGSPAVLRTVTPGTAEMVRSMTAAIREISAGARHDGALGDRVQHWKRVFQDRGEDLKAAMGAWQARHRLERCLTTGFLDGSHPIVDGYELKVRLDHMLRRLRALQGAAASAVPALVEPGLYLGDAVCADAHHVLRHLGVTHIVNVTEDLLLPPPEAGFSALRVPLRDVDDECIAPVLGVVAEQLAAARAGGGCLLVHCHEGRSRSVALVLAYLMAGRGMTLRGALELVRSVRPQASPNAGFLQALAALDARLHGSASLHVGRSSRPQARRCPQCGVVVGVSQLSLDHHVRAKHGGGGGGGGSVGSSSSSSSSSSVGCRA